MIKLNNLEELMGENGEGMKILLIFAPNLCMVVPSWVKIF